MPAGLLLSRAAKVTHYWAFAGLGSKMPANVCPWYQKAGLGAYKNPKSRPVRFVAPSEARYALGGGVDTP